MKNLYYDVTALCNFETNLLRVQRSINYRWNIIATKPF